jgi:hypothetical protein
LRPFSTEVVQVIVSPSAACFPQTSQVLTRIRLAPVSSAPAHAAGRATKPPGEMRGARHDGVVPGSCEHTRSGRGGVPQLARARARRACRAACSALRLSRRTAACWRPRRSCCASPRRACICARARSSCIKLLIISLFPFWWVLIKEVTFVVDKGPSCEAGPPGSGGLLVLAGTPTRTLAGNHHSLEEELSAPDSPGLPPLQCSGEAEIPDRAVLAQRLGELDVGR